MNRNLLVVLEITPTSPLTHGMGNEGNEVQILTRPALVDGARIDLPCVSGASLRALLREAAVLDQLDTCGVAEATLDALRLLSKGGRNDSGKQGYPLGQVRQLREDFPVLSLWGSMDAGVAVRGKLLVSDVHVWSEEGLNAGVVHREYMPLQVNGEPAPDAGIHPYPSTPPIPVAACRSELTYYRHDLSVSQLATRLLPAERKLIENKQESTRAKREAGEKVGKEGKASEAMPHSYQQIVAGTPMLAEIRAMDVTPVEVEAFGRAIYRWITGGGLLGGAHAKGHGQTRVRLAGALTWTPGPGRTVAAGGELMTLSSGPGLYAAHLADPDRLARVRSLCATETRG